LAKGEGKVISYEDLEAKRAEKEAARLAREKGKGTRGRKRKPLGEADGSGANKTAANVPEPATKPARGRKRKIVVESDEDELEEGPKAKMIRTSGKQVVQTAEPEPMALVAIMSKAQGAEDRFAQAATC
jgi:hypothetical protein